MLLISEMAIPCLEAWMSAMVSTKLLNILLEREDFPCFLETINLSNDTAGRTVSATARSQITPAPEIECLTFGNLQTLLDPKLMLFWHCRRPTTAPFAQLYIQNFHGTVNESQIHCCK